MGMQVLGFGGGCHWCTEAIFDHLKGVKKVEQGWISSTHPFTSYSEGVLVHFDNREIKMEELLEVHIATHSSKNNHKYRSKYRSAVYYPKPIDFVKLNKILIRFQKDLDQKLALMVIPFVDFRLNSETYLGYYQRNPDAPFCERFIKPKLAMIKEHKPKLYQ
jgi:peptide-methionine (S)-S-oxide reductase